MLQGVVNMRRADLIKWAAKHQIAEFPDGTRPKYEMDRAIEAAYVRGELTRAAINDVREFDPEAEPIEASKSKSKSKSKYKKGAG